MVSRRSHQEFQHRLLRIICCLHAEARNSDSARFSLINGAAQRLHLYVPDADATWNQPVAAGCYVERIVNLRDPRGCPAYRRDWRVANPPQTTSLPHPAPASQRPSAAPDLRLIPQFERQIRESALTRAPENVGSTPDLVPRSMARDIQLYAQRLHARRATRCGSRFGRFCRARGGAFVDLGDTVELGPG